ncbi:allophanate hydrolase [Kineosporia sp. R_H_3]|uniref:allophanate hydrolase n=1 Tax=Kineosporia sp. R_H_3 TaxID=1961848 RepID=UPI000B4BAC55|nr:allophanate hydrolase [Kineosporia sp. R_H_3]
MSAGGTTAVERVRAAYVRLAAADRPEVWITLRAQADAEADAAAVDARVAAGEDLPLAGRTLAVKNNIDVAGMPTTAACPDFAFVPAADAPAVARLRAAGCVVLGATNLDQFATGLVGTRSPYGAVRDVRRPGYVSGGSSSGSAVAVALGVADLALGTDTAGSGRVPASFQGVVGLKPTRGLVPTLGVVPACRELDCVSVFAADVALARTALTVLAGPAAGDPTSRAWPASTPLGAPAAPRVGVPDEALLATLDAPVRAAVATAVGLLEAAGAAVVPVDAGPVVEAGALLYGGAFVAQRYAAFGAWADAHPGSVDPTVLRIVQAARDVPAHAYVADTERLDALRPAAAALFAGLDALLLPTVPEQPTIADVAADPIGANARLGRFTNGCNLLDLAAIAVPVHEEPDGAQVGVTLFGPAFTDHVLADVAALLTGGPSSGPAASQAVAGVPAQPVVLFGAHMSGLPLNPALTALGARLVGPCTTAPVYRLHDLGGAPRRPGAVRVADGGGAVDGELWLLPPAAFGPLLASIPPGLGLGAVELADGSRPVGFLCEAEAAAGAPDVTAYGGWRAYLDSLATPSPHSATPETAVHG